jgi:hypothetical protein
MIRTIIIAIWACVVCLGSSFVTSAFLARRGLANDKEKEAMHHEVKPLRPITIPILRSGSLQGYIVLQLDYILSRNVLKTGIDPEVIIADETFRSIYSDEKIDLSQVAQINLDSLLATVVRRTADRMHSDAVQELLVHELNYVFQKDLKR